MRQTTAGGPPHYRAVASGLVLLRILGVLGPTRAAVQALEHSSGFGKNTEKLQQRRTNEAEHPPQLQPGAFSRRARGGPAWRELAEETVVTGCADSAATNYRAAATVDSGSCRYSCATLRQRLPTAAAVEQATCSVYDSQSAAWTGDDAALHAEAASSSQTRTLKVGAGAAWIFQGRAESGWQKRPELPANAADAGIIGLSADEVVALERSLGGKAEELPPLGGRLEVEGEESGGGVPRRTAAVALRYVRLVEQKTRSVRIPAFRD